MRGATRWSRFFAVTSSALLLRGLRSANLRYYSAYAFAAALGAYTHLTMVFIVIAHALACAWLIGVPRGRGEAWRRWQQPLVGFTLAAVLTLLLYAPMFVDVRQFFTRTPRNVAVATPGWAGR
jgi:uncharacterized membrane protein